MSVRRSVLVIFIAAVGLLAVAGPAVAGSFGSGDAFGQGNAFVVLTGRLDLPKGTEASDAVIFNGDAAIAGNVSNNVVAFNGDVVVTGSVGKNVVALNGRVTLGPGAHVGGDVVSRFVPTVAGSATVGGRIRGVNRFNVNAGEFTFVGRFLVWIATTVSSFLLGLALVLFAPRAADAVAGTAVRKFGASIGFGFLLLIGVPFVAVVAIGILVGIPLGLGVLLALGFFYWLGYTFGAYALGRRLVAAPTHRLLAFLAGWGIFRAIALIPVLGGLGWLAATVWGLGALAIAARTAGREPVGAAAVAIPAGGPPVPPPPPIPSAQG
jgi:hypothetical protein